MAMSGTSGAALPVPRGRGSKVPDDFNGDGAPDLVLDDLVHDGLGDDAGIGVVYGKKGHGLVPGARQLLRPTKYAAPTEGETPAAFDSGRAATWTRTASPIWSCRRIRPSTGRGSRRCRCRSSSAARAGSPTGA